MEAAAARRATVLRSAGAGRGGGAIVFGLVEDAQALVDRQEPPDLVVEGRGGHRSVADGVGQSGAVGPARPGHLQVDAGGVRAHRRRHPVPVGQDETFEAPFPPQDVGQELAGPRSTTSRSGGCSRS